MSDVKRLLVEATPLPWEHDDSERRSVFGFWITDSDVVAVREVARCDESADAALIVHAVNALPDYEAAIEAAEYALAFMADPEGLAHKRDEWREGLRSALRRLRDEVPA